MDANFTFPRHQPPTPRPAPPVGSPPSPTTNRESNALRASVLDVALELGIGNNTTVTNWMFSNSLREEDEEELRSPSLIHESTATSEESSSAQHPLTPPPSHIQPNIQSNPFTALESHSYMRKSATDPAIQSILGAGIPFPEVPIPPRPVTPSRGKLRKKRADGYESDGGYVSDPGKKKKDKESALEKKELAKEAKNRAKEEKLREKKEKEEERKRKKSLGKFKKGEEKDGYATGYETSGASKASKSSKRSKEKLSGDVGYETDSGYVSSASGKGKSKGRFFGLRSKQSKADLRQEEVPPLPTTEKEPVILPIASRFATTIDSPIVPGESLDSMISRAMDAPMAAALAAPPLPALSSMPSYSHATPIHFSPTNRESLSSAESGGSLSPSSASSFSHSRRRGVLLLGQDLRHSEGSGNHSTITPTTQVPLPLSTSTPTSALPSITLPNTLDARVNPSMDILAGSSQVKHSPSFSLTSSSSGLSPVQHFSPNSVNSPPSAFSPQVFPTARNPSLSRGLSITKKQLLQVTTSPSAFTAEPAVSPSPVSVSSAQPSRPSPTVIQPPHVTPTAATASPHPSPINGTQPLRISPTTASQPSRPSPATGVQPLRPRPRFPPTDGFGPRPTLTPGPVPASPMSNRRSPSPNPQGVGRRPLLGIVPSTGFVVPSPSASSLPLPSPNVLAYYDIPPPSPPPSGPLPRIPPPPGSFSSRTRTQERPGGDSQDSIARSRSPEQGLFSQPIPNIQRGREAPFPARPILPQTAPSTSVGQGLEATIKVPRYRELYGLPLPREHNNQVDRRELDRTRDWEHERLSPPPGPSADRASGGSWDASLAYDDDDDDDMRDVLERFEEAQMDTEIDLIQNELNGGKALGRSRSFEAIRKRITGRDEDSSDSHDETLFETRKSSTEDGGDTNSRWSGSIYSRASVLDADKSEEARQRFVKRVEDLYSDGGREKIIPPVPKIPDAFVGAGGPSWTRF